MIENKFLKFEAEGRDFAKFLRSQIGKNYWDLENAGKVRKYPFFSTHGKWVGKIWST